MSISPFSFGCAAVLIALGAAIIAVEVFGLFKLKYVLNRIHSAAMGDSLGILLITCGLMIIYGISFASLKLMFILLLFWCASPVCSHLTAKLEARTNEQLEEECELPGDPASGTSCASTPAAAATAPDAPTPTATTEEVRA